MKYFELATNPDSAAYFEQFSPDAVVEDDGHTYHGFAEIRSWRTEVPSARYDVRQVDSDASTAHAVVDISGDFPGSPVTLGFDFEYDHDGRIVVLRIGV